MGECREGAGRTARRPGEAPIRRWAAHGVAAYEVVRSLACSRSSFSAHSDAANEQGGRVRCRDSPAGGADHAPERRRLPACSPRRGGPRWHDRMRPRPAVRPPPPPAHPDRDPQQIGGAARASPAPHGRSAGAADAPQARAAAVAPGRAAGGASQPAVSSSVSRPTRHCRRRRLARCRNCDRAGRLVARVARPREWPRRRRQVVLRAAM
jgi:hypothetical protein